MKNNRAEITPMAFFIIMLVVVVLGVFTISYVMDISMSMASVEHEEESNLTYNSATTLTAEEGITSSEVKTYNNSWMEFDGVNDVVFSEQSDSDLDVGTGNYTISLWLKSGTNQSAQFRRIIEYGGFDQGGWSIQYAGYGPNVLFYYGAESPGEWSCSYGNFLNDSAINDWTNFIYSFNGTKIQLYKDGNFIGSETNCTYFPIIDDLEISSLTGTLMGLDELRIYNKSLSNAEIISVYNSGRQANSSLPSDGLVLWYSFDEQTGTTVHDKSGNGNHGE